MADQNHGVMSKLQLGHYHQFQSTTNILLPICQRQ